MRGEALLVLVATGCVNTADPPERVQSSIERLGSLAQPPARAPTVQDTASELTLETLLEIAEQRNPRLAAGRAELDAAAGRAIQAALPPNPSLTLDHESPIGSGFLGDSRSTIGVAQTWVRSDRLAFASEAETRSGEARAEELQALRRDVRAEVRRTFVELLHLRAAAELRDGLAATARRSFDLAKARFEAKAAIEPEVLRTELAVVEQETALAGIGRETEAATRRLEYALGGLRVDPARLRGKLTGDVAETDLARLAQWVRERHPSVLAARREIEAASASASQAKEERRRDPTFRVGFGHDGVEENWIVEAGVELPIPFYDDNRGRVRETEAHMERTRRGEEAVLLDLLASLSRAVGDLGASRERLAALRARVLPAAQRSLDATREAYAVGKLTSLDVLEAQRALAEARLAELALVRDVNLGDVEVRRIAGDAP